MNRPIRAPSPIHYVRRQGRGLMIPVTIQAGDMAADLAGVVAVARLRCGPVSRPLVLSIPAPSTGEIVITGTDADLETYGGPKPTDVLLILTDALGTRQDIVIPLREDSP